MLSAAVSLAFASFLCSYCNTNDVSWGNRPGGAHAVSADVAAQDRRFRSFRSMLVVLCKYADFEPNFKLNRPQPLTFGTFFSLYTPHRLRRLAGLGSNWILSQGLRTLGESSTRTYFGYTVRYRLRVSGCQCDPTRVLLALAHCDAGELVFF